MNNKDNMVITNKGYWEWSEAVITVSRRICYGPRKTESRKQLKRLYELADFLSEPDITKEEALLRKIIIKELKALIKEIKYV